MITTTTRETQTMNGIDIRLLQPADCMDELTALLNLSYKQLDEKGFHFPASTQDKAATVKRIGNAQCYVAVKEGKIVATIVYRTPVQATGAAWINLPFVASCVQFAVHPGFQNQGIGSKLMEVVEKQAMRDMATELAISTAEGATELRNYYQKRRYRFIDHIQWPGTDFKSVILSKRL